MSDILLIYSTNQCDEVTEIQTSQTERKYFVLMLMLLSYLSLQFNKVHLYSNPFSIWTESSCGTLCTPDWMFHNTLYPIHKSTKRKYNFEIWFEPNVFLYISWQSRFAFTIPPPIRLTRNSGIKNRLETKQVGSTQHGSSKPGNDLQS